MDNMKISKKELLHKIKQLEKQQAGITAEINDLSEMLNNLPCEEIPEQLEFSNDEPIWYMNTSGKVIRRQIRCWNDAFANHRVFKSERMARLFAEKTQFIADCMHFKELYDRNYVPDFEDDCQEKYFVYFNHTKHKYIVSSTITIEIKGCIYFSTEKIANRFAEYMNKRSEVK